MSWKIDCDELIFTDRTGASGSVMVSFTYCLETVISRVGQPATPMSFPSFSVPSTWHSLFIIKCYPVRDIDSQKIVWVAIQCIWSLKLDHVFNISCIFI